MTQEISSSSSHRDTKTQKQNKKKKPSQTNPTSKGYILLGSIFLLLSLLLAFLFPKNCKQLIYTSQISNVFCWSQKEGDKQNLVNLTSVGLEEQEAEGSCGEDLCSIEGGFGNFMGFDVTKIQGEKLEGEVEGQNYESDLKHDKPSSSSKWWEEGQQLWKVVKSSAEFDQLLSQKGVVVVDYFAVWCNGCKRIHNELNLIAKSLQSKCTFLKVNVDGLKQIVQREGVKSLPYIQVYRDGIPIFGFQGVPWKVQKLERNLQLILSNPDKGVELDVDGIGTLVDLDLQQNNDNKQLIEQKKEFISGESDPLLTKFVKSSQQQREPRIDVSLDTVSEKMTPQRDEEFLRRKQQFLNKYGDDYGYGGRIEQLYADEVAPRMGPNEHYMDYTGASVYCNSQLKASLQELESNMFGNPHSANPSSKLTEEKVEQVRDLILEFFGGDPSEYQAVFTKSATGALQIVGETFPWNQGSLFRYLRENHNSVLGIREYALKYGGSFDSVDEEWVEDWVRGRVAFEHPLCGNFSDPTYSLFAFPGEDNFAGVKYPLSWIKQIQSLSHPGHKWLVLLDAAAYVPTQPLNLTQTPADFVAISFYKMFGYPTGIGALILRTEHADILRKTFWGGGAVSLVTSQNNFRVLKCKPSEKLEDGTVAFLDIINLKHGFNMIEQLGGIYRVQAHVRSLTEYLYDRLSSLGHSNGRAMLEIFGKHHYQNAGEVQGGILNFEVITPSGQIFSYKKFETEAAEAGFHVRTGAECNPGACYKYLGVDEHEIQKLAEVKQGCQDDVEFVEVEKPQEGEQFSDGCKKQMIKVPLGSVRTSLGYMSTFEDCEEFARFVKHNYQDREC